MRKKLVFLDEEEETRSTRKSSNMPQWSEDEVRFLIEHVIQHTDGISWPSTHDPLFWVNTGRFIQTQSGSLYRRSGIFIARSLLDSGAYMLSGF